MLKASSLSKKSPANAMWAGHVFLTEDGRIPKQLNNGIRIKRGLKKLGYKDTLKASLKDCHSDCKTFVKSASDINAWRQYVSNGVDAMRKTALLRRRNKKRRRKERQAITA